MPKERSSVRRSAAEWSEIVQAWKASGETAKQYASRHGLNAGTLGWWRSQLSKQAYISAAPRPGRRARRNTSAAAFTEVVVKPPAPIESPLEVVTRSGHRVVVRGRVDAASLRAVLSVLETC